MTSIRRQIFIPCAPGEVFDPPFGILGDIADKAVFEKRHEDDAEQILAGLKALCEGAATP